MSKNTSREKNQRDDERCYCPFTQCGSLHLERVLKYRTKRHCGRCGYIEGIPKEYRPFVIYISIICIYIDRICTILYCFNVCYAH